MIIRYITQLFVSQDRANTWILGLSSSHPPLHIPRLHPHLISTPLHPGHTWAFNYDTPTQALLTDWTDNLMEKGILDTVLRWYISLLVVLPLFSIVLRCSYVFTSVRILNLFRFNCFHSLLMLPKILLNVYAHAMSDPIPYDLSPTELPFPYSSTWTTRRGQGDGYVEGKTGNRNNETQTTGL